MKKLTTTLMVITFLTLLSVSGCKKDTITTTDNSKVQSLKTAMRVLWSDHALWTRNVILNIIDRTTGTTDAVSRLLKNQDDIGNAIKPYYGDAAGEALTVLLKEHITTAADLLTAAKNGNTETFNTADTLWYANGEAIATFLSSANPNWPLSDWKAMMNDHLDYTLEEAVARLNGDYAADVAAYEKVYTELMMMADMLSDGIIKQFPEKFK